jgi:uncharacterized membrane protein YcaP (DUF421 family)
VIADHLRREGLDEEMLEAALREHGVADLKTDGSISVVPLRTETKRAGHPLTAMHR